MRVLSLWQPWATLVVIGAKCNETRSWPSAYHGLLLIHAAKRFKADERAHCLFEPFRSVLREAGYDRLSDLPLGAIIGCVTMTGCWQTESVRDKLSVQEYAFGNYDDDRYAHIYINPIKFATPIPYTGRQGFFSYDGELPEELALQIQRGAK